MKKTLIVLLTLMGFAVAQEAPKSKPASKTHAAKAEPKKNTFTPDEVQWGPAPPFLPPGAQVAVLEGNPFGTMDYVIRVKVPDGYKVAPHWHPKRENVTIISGTLNFGMGDTFDESKMKAFPAGSFAYLDPSMHHYAKSTGETVFQISGMAPVKFFYVNPKDDPSKQAKSK